MMMPPMTLMKTISRPAMASPRTNLRGAVHGAEEGAFVFQLLAARAASFSLMRPAERSASIAICLPGMASRVKRAATSAMRRRALGDDDEVHDHQDREHDHPDDEVAAHHEAAEGLDDVAGRVPPVWPLARIRRVVAMLSASRSSVASSSTVGKRRELQRLLDQQRRHQDQDRER